MAQIDGAGKAGRRQLRTHRPDPPTDRRHATVLAYSQPRQMAGPNRSRRAQLAWSRSIVWVAARTLFDEACDQRITHVPEISCYLCLRKDLNQMSLRSSVSSITHFIESFHRYRR